MSGAGKIATLQRFRPAVGLGFCTTAMAMFGVVMFFFSPADLQALPPRQEVSGARSAQGAAIAQCSGQQPLTLGAAELTSAEIDSLYALLRGARTTEDTVDDMPLEDRACFLDVDLRRFDEERARVVSKPGLYIFGGRDYGLLVRVHTDGSLPHFRVPASPEVLKAFDELIVATNAKRQRAPSGSP